MVPKKCKDSLARHKPCDKSSVHKSDKSESSTQNPELSVPVTENLPTNVTPTNFDLSNSSAFYIDISNTSPQDLTNVSENSKSSSYSTSTPSTFDLSNQSAHFIDISNSSPQSINSTFFEQIIEPNRLDFNDSEFSTLPYEHTVESNHSKTSYVESSIKPIFDVNSQCNTTPSTFNLSNHSASFINISNDSPKSLNFDKNDSNFMQLSSHTKSLLNNHNQISNSMSNEKLEFKSTVSSDSSDLDLTPSPYLTCNRPSNSNYSNMCNISNSSGPYFDSQREGGTLNSTPFYSNSNTNSNANSNANLSRDFNHSGRVFISQRGEDILTDTPSQVDSTDSNVNSNANLSNESLGTAYSNLKRLCEDIFNTNSVPNFKRFR